MDLRLDQLKPKHRWTNFFSTPRSGQYCFDYFMPIVVPMSMLSRPSLVSIPFIQPLLSLTNSSAYTSVLLLIGLSPQNMVHRHGPSPTLSVESEAAEAAEEDSPAHSLAHLSTRIFSSSILGITCCSNEPTDEAPWMRARKSVRSFISSFSL